MSSPTVYARLRRVIDAVDTVLMSIGCLMLFALMMVVVSDVSLRYLFNAPLNWSYEIISSYLMPGLFFMAASHTLKSNAHVCVDILHNYVGTRTRYVFEAVISTLAAPIFGLATVVSAQNTWQDLQSGAASSSGMELPTWSISLMLPLGFGMLTLRLVLHAFGYIGTLVSGRVLKHLPAISGTEELTS
ncbi:MAG: TRAP transporter small permease [Rubrivivax sp.]|nr:TRAP transporter small permease [Rubrivivax sp.]